MTNMKFYLIIIILFFGTTSLAQELKKQKIGNELYQEEFFVLKSDRKIRHGEYKNYKNGELNIIGSYDNNKKTGTWKFYHNGALVQTYDYSKNLLDSEPVKSQYLVFDNNQYIEVKIESTPTYIGGKPGLEKSINNVIRYPEQARRMVIEGIVLFSVVIDENGTLEEVEIISGPREFYDEIKAGIKNIDQSWIAGSNNEKKIKCKLLYALEFKLTMCGNYGCSTMFLK